MRAMFLLLILVVPGTELFAADWFSVTGQEGKFRAEFPSGIVLGKREIPTKVGKLFMYSCTCSTQNGHVAFLVMYNDYPSSAIKNSTAKQILENVAKGVIKTKKGNVVKKNIPKMGSALGQYIIFKGIETRNGQNKKVVMHHRAYLHGNRLYQIMIYSDGKGTIKQADVEKFYQSFKILGMEKPK